MQDLTPQNEAADGPKSARQPPSNDPVFISYARENEAFVLRLAGALKDRGIPVWLDQWDIPPGADWNRNIDRALHESSKVIAVLSPEAVVSRQVRAEIQSAVDAEEKAVFPVLYKNCDVPRILKLYHFSDFRESRNFESELARLAEALGSAPIPPPPKPPPSEGPSWRSFVKKFGRLTQQRRLLLAAIIGAAGVIAILAVLAVRYVGSPLAPTPEIHLEERKPELRLLEQTGNLQVSVNVDEARVSLDGTEVGIARNAVPLILRGISAGEHRLQVEATGYEPKERHISIIAGEWIMEAVTLPQSSSAPVGR
jgi:TIR domain/PEGA domain